MMTGPLPGPPSARAILSWPLPELSLLDRMLVRGAALVSRRNIHSIAGLEHISPDRDPFILAVNHSTRREALLVPPFLFLLRQGQRIHFMADWNFRLIPGVNLLYRRAGVITVLRKPARPRFLDGLKPLFAEGTSPAEQARRHLCSGRSIGVFPEGTVNRDPLRLKRGRPGAAQLSLETGVPVVPVGLRYPAVPHGLAIPEGSPMAIEIGTPLIPSAAGKPAYPEIRAWHGRIMTAIARLSGKSWEFGAQEAER
ncbi:MAG: 1-acyl-sn-glycerol-3-phosphate acyltransferase [Bradyrhizobiaceae bacterium]|nr:1-acyl-sn-glycerol-3-phosphate acyltransferase [Bradyrhizobiaceae bacterium]